MITITVPQNELYNSKTMEFITLERDTELVLEHSLISISKWESKWKKPFLKKQERSVEETIDYVKCMTVNRVSNPLVYELLTEDDYKRIKAYIDDPMTATTFRDSTNKSVSREGITSELIYYWMISYNIPLECEKWHLNRLLTLINICEKKNSPQKKMSKQDIMKQNRELNEARRRQFNSRG